MKLRITPSTQNKGFESSPKVAMVLEPDDELSVFYAEDTPQPDRHFLIGLAQIALFALEENDRQSVELALQADWEVEKGSQIVMLKPELVIVQLMEGSVLVLAVGEASRAKKNARSVIKSLTGRIRLDVP